MFLNIYFMGYTSTFFNTVETSCAARAIDLFFIDLSVFSSFVTIVVRGVSVYWVGLGDLLGLGDFVFVSSISSESEKLTISSL